LSLPMQVFMPFRFDLVPVFLAVAGIALADAGRRRAGGSAVGLAVLAKVWPVVVAPALVIRRGSTGAVTFLLVVFAGVVGWLLLTGLQGPSQVASFRGATGWQVESTVGSLVWLLTGATPRIELGAVRVGAADQWQTVVLGGVTLGVVAACWFRARNREVDPAGMPAMAAVAALTVFSPVASAQYIAWILPWSAIAIAERRRPAVTVLSASASLLAAAVFLVYWDVTGTLGLLQGLALARAACVIGLVVVWFREGPVVDGSSS
jgi:hypothetical protein